MTLDLKAIENAANNEKNAGEFAQLMHVFRSLGVTKYDYLVEEGLYRFFDDTTHIDIKLNGIPTSVSPVSDSFKIKAAVKQAQAGQIDFARFTQLAGNAGVLRWTSDLLNKRVSYWDNNNKPLLIEPIPGL
ncbi:DUF1398 family protein [Paucilactobacillus kaifaensis]|uniref:DUF1398 family protein n=1 Tax=Paucilactobacillus kaifaensis TaxID=2559921 RepID=UPI0010F88AF4|nr:DUF1398 family protein [Paucilactobacillus kaifaensis]